MNATINALRAVTPTTIYVCPSLLAGVRCDYTNVQQALNYAASLPASRAPITIQLHSGTYQTTGNKVAVFQPLTIQGNCTSQSLVLISLVLVNARVFDVTSTDGTGNGLTIKCLSIEANNNVLDGYAVVAGQGSRVLMDRVDVLYNGNDYFSNEVFVNTGAFLQMVNCNLDTAHGVYGLVTNTMAQVIANNTNISCYDVQAVGLAASSQSKITMYGGSVHCNGGPAMQCQTSGTIKTFGTTVSGTLGTC